MRRAVTEPGATLLCGHAKSGTTLVQSLLDGHPELIVIPEETKYFARIHAHPLRRRPSYLLSRTRLARLARREPGIYDYGHLDGAAFADALCGELGALPASRRVLPAVARAYARAAGLDAGRARAWVEKTPGHEHALARARELWPELRAIYLVRDPRDVFVSFRAKRATRGRGLDVAPFCRRWAASLAAWDAFAARAPGAALAIRYETLVADPGPVLHALTRFLGVAMVPSLREPTIAGRPFGGNSMHGDAFDAISAAPVGRHAGRLDSAAAREIETRLAPAFARFGWS